MHYFIATTSVAQGKAIRFIRFRDYLGYANCEVINVGARSWRAIDGPSFGAIRWFGRSPVSALGALHWIPQFDRSDHIVSMEVNSEKFHQVALPKSGRIYDGLWS